VEIPKQRDGTCLWINEATRASEAELPGLRSLGDRGATKQTKHGLSHGNSLSRELTAWGS